MTFAEFVLLPVVHEAATCLRFVGLRDRLRCPRCKSVGTFKPHGAWLDLEDMRSVRRWMCKWCGFYLGPEGEKQCVIDTEHNAWRFVEECPDGITCKQAIDASAIPDAWPWRG